VLNLGLQVQQDQGVVRQNNTGGTEIEVRKGSTAEVSGTGYLPRSTVQVFLPLQGANAKEIARIPVDEAGTFSGDAVFATRVNERPLPIGKQVLQVVSLDEEGQQSVVEMTVNIAQSAPAPESDRTVGQRPELSPGQFLATNAGEPEVVTVIPVPESRQARVEGSGWQVAVDIPSENGGVSSSDAGGALLQLVRDETAVVSGTGFMAGTRADVWLFSEPTLLGTVEIDENGNFSGEVNIDANVVAVGEHTLQLQGVGEDGYVRAANLGVVVNDTVAQVTTEEAVGGFLWWLWLSVILVALVVWFAIWRYRRSRES
jgi:tRNA (Thr-GGU) A37 N-methylase